MSELLTISGRN